MCNKNAELFQQDSLKNQMKYTTAPDKKTADFALVPILATTEVLLAAHIPAHLPSQPFSYQGRWYISFGSSENPAEIAQHFYYTLYQLDLLEMPQAFVVQTSFGSGSIAVALEHRLKKILGA
jgi:hypothetical protein